MGNPSSTSSSNPLQYPLAGVLALLAIVCIDQLAFGFAFPWKWAWEHVPTFAIAESARTRDQRGLFVLEAAPAGRARVAVLGSSRAQAGFHPERIEGRDRPRAAIAEFTHPGMHPFEMRSIAAAIAARQPDVVVLVASEFETHYPLELRVPLTYGSASALADLVFLSGLDFAFERRSKLLQLFVASALHSYRLRSVLRHAGATDVAHFRFDPRLQGSAEGQGVFFEDVDSAPIPLDLQAATLDAFARHLPKKARFSAMVEMHQLRDLARGENVRIQQALLRRSARLLRDAGAEVILLEAPIFPPARVLYDAQLRDDFLRFGRDLSEDSGVTFVPLEAGPAFTPQDFYDITHLQGDGALKFTRWILREIEAALGRLSSSTGRPIQWTRLCSSADSRPSSASAC